jgi:hypothetical protein
LKSARLPRYTATATGVSNYQVRATTHDWVDGDTSARIAQTTDSGASLRMAALFETGDPRYVWLTRLQVVGVGERVGTAVKYDIYALK